MSNFPICYVFKQNLETRMKLWTVHEKMFMLVRDHPLGTVGVTGRFGPIPVRTPGRFGPIPFRSGRFGLILVGRFGPLYII